MEVWELYSRRRSIPYSVLFMLLRYSLCGGLYSVLLNSLVPITRQGFLPLLKCSNSVSLCHDDLSWVDVTLAVGALLPFTCTCLEALVEMPLAVSLYCRRNCSVWKKKVAYPWGVGMFEVVEICFCPNSPQ